MATITRPASTGRWPGRRMAVAGLVAVEVVAIAAGVTFAIGLGGHGAPEPSGPPPASPTATPSPDPTTTPAPNPTPSPTDGPAPTPTPGPTRPPEPPACAYADRLTAHRRYVDWRITLLDPIFRLPRDYAPRDLVDTADAGLNGGHLVRRVLIEDLRALASAARRADAAIEIRSAYRSYARQQATFEYWVGVAGYEAALRTSARPGHSEHQLGTTIDVTSLGGRAPWDDRDWANTKAGAWMAANAWHYGFVMSYPKVVFERTCYDYEPWHYRYVGRELASRIAASGLTPREFLWRLQAPAAGAGPDVGGAAGDADGLTDRGPIEPPTIDPADVTVGA